MTYEQARTRYIYAVASVSALVAACLYVWFERWSVLAAYALMPLVAMLVVAVAAWFWNSRLQQRYRRG